MSANVSCPCAWTISKDVELAHFDIDEILHVKFNFFQNCFARQFYFCSLVQLCPTKLRIKERSIYMAMHMYHHEETADLLVWDVSQAVASTQFCHILMQFWTLESDFNLV